MDDNQQLINEAKNLEYSQLQGQKQKLLKCQNEQQENLIKFQSLDKQKKNTTLQQNYENQLNKLLQQHSLEINNFDQILNERKNQIQQAEHVKKEEEEKKQKILKKLKEQEKTDMPKIEPKKQKIDKIKDINKVQNILE
ncbi:hypothetical protein PPERSA_12684 [Pseudocohnilembus persalinus]|uniref:Uncharacterized protein n=1 Tax=Pseudocohnilembus persalinus TaxID=266149 RepID=A0A0V0QMR3_PSEPJ|nr:hypothetical protein PPERSA_12684 [Pseudocohnilembus persalinus]|eukprot:KRX03554.1 hypothetical protein PPERSA_12684 [Pseudocohnilembus persalinus]